MSFPAPRGPIKSTKAPTQANFSLPGEAMSAKFKAAREARALKEAEEAKRKVFKARPAPSMSNKAAPVVRQTSTSKARESIIGGTKALTSSTSAVGTKNRANSVATSKPASKAPAAARKSIVPSSKGGVTVPKRASTAMSKPLEKTNGTVIARPSTATSRVTSSSGTGTSKGKEVFNRTKQSKNLEAEARKEREEAAKKARAEAAERSRALSREWAEKRKVKKAAGAGAGVGAAVAA